MTGTGSATEHVREIREKKRMAYIETFRKMEHEDLAMMAGYFRIMAEEFHELLLEPIILKLKE